MMVMIMMVIVMTMIVIVVMTMVVIVVMTMVVTGVIVAGVAMPAGIGTAFRIERGLDLDGARTEPAHHLLDDMVLADAQATTDDLCRQVAVAEVPGDPHQMLRIAPPDLDQRLRRSDHFDQPAVLEDEAVAATQRHRFLEVEQEVEPARAGHRHAPAMAVVEIEHHRIGGLGRPVAGRQNLDSADHAHLTGSRPFRR